MRTKINENITICITFINPRSLVFLNNSRSCPAIALRPEVEPLGDNNSPMIVASDPMTINSIDPQSIVLNIIYIILFS